MPPITTGNRRRAHAPPTRVWTRASWGADWTLWDHVEVSAVEFATNPTMPEAQLVWHYGRGMYPGEIHRHVIEPRDAMGHYVKIQIDPDGLYETNAIPVWYGRVIECQEDRRGSVLYNGQTIPTGTQTYLCWGLESQLDQEPVFRSYVRKPSGAATEIGRALPFNAGTGSPRDQADDRRIANSSLDPSGAGVYTICEAIDEANLWSGGDIIEYLLEYYGPRDPNGSPLRVVLPEDAETAQAYLFLNFPKLQPEGKSLKRILDELLDRRRALGWYLRVDTSGAAEEIQLQTFTMTDVDLQLPENKTIRANPDQVALDFDRSLDVLKAEVRSTDASRFDQVILRGARIGAVFTISTKGGGLVQDWTTTEQDLYNKGATLAAGYGALERHQKQNRNDAVRSKPSLERVYSWFALAPDWDGNAEDGEGGGFQTALVPWDRENRRMNWAGGFNFWVPGLRFERELLLREGVDYTGNKAEGPYCRDDHPDNRKRQRLATFAMIKVEDDGSGGTRYQLVDKLTDRLHNVLGIQKVRNWSCSVRSREDAPGLILRVGGTAQQMVLAASDFVPADSTESYSGDLDWRDNILATVYVLADSHLEIAEPDGGDLPLEDPGRRIVIDLPEYHLDYMVPGTVVDVQNGELKRSTSGGILRDDTAKLEALAKLASQWYCMDRKTVSLQYRQVRKTVWLGQIITALGPKAAPEPIRTCVTRVRFDLVQGMTTVQTQNAELDLKLF